MTLLLYKICMFDVGYVYVKINFSFVLWDVYVKLVYSEYLLLYISYMIIVIKVWMYNIDIFLILDVTWMALLNLNWY